MSDLVQQLRDRIEQLESVIGADRSTASQMRQAFGVEPLQAKILGMLYARELVTRAGLYTVLYEGKPESDWPDVKHMDAMICKLRRQLERNGFTIKIKTVWSEGWSISPADKALMRAILDGPPDAAPALPPSGVPPLAPGSTKTLRERRLAFLDGH